MYLNKYYFNTADPIMAELWDDLCARKLAAGVHLTILPQSGPRLDKIYYNVIPMGHYRLDVDGGRILYDFVLYDDPAKVIMAGYCLVLFEPTGRLIPASHGFNAEIESVPIPPLPAPPPGWTPEELPEPSRTAQAVEALRSGTARTQAEAARMFGITPGTVGVAARRDGVAVRSDESSRTAQAVEALRSGVARTQAEAARMFGIASAGVCVAAKAAGIQPQHQKGKTEQAVEWLLANPGRTQAEAARMFGAQQSNISAAMGLHKARSK